MRYLISAVTVAFATLVTSTVADAAPRSVQAGVAVRNTTDAPLSSWNLTAQLARGTHVQHVSGGRARTRGRTLTVTPAALGAGRTAQLTVKLRGKAPTAWAAAGRACAVHAHGSRLAVTCVVAPAVLPAPAPAGGPAPAPSGPPASIPAPAPVGGTPPAPVPTSTPAPAPSATPTPAPSSSPAAVGFAPYTDMAGWPPPAFTDYVTAGIKKVTLGFVTQGATACDPTWGGQVTYPAGGPTPYQLAQVQAYRQAGGAVIPAFGGAAGSELAVNCTDIDKLAEAYQKVIDAYGVTRIDFDIEGPTEQVFDIYDRRAKAIAILQADAAKAGRTLDVVYTLPSEPGGLDQYGIPVLTNAIANGVKLSMVNIMAMNFDGVADPADMGQLAIDAGTALYSQLETYYPSLSSAERWRMIGITPMAGINDYTSQTFTVDNVKTLTTWANAHHVGMLSMWQVRRDTPAWDFSHAFEAFTG